MKASALLRQWQTERPHEWTKGSYSCHCPDTQYCAIGKLGLEAGLDPTGYFAPASNPSHGRRLFEAFGLTPLHLCNIVYLNDRDGLDGVIAYLEGEQL